MNDIETGEWLVALRKRAGLDPAAMAQKTKIAPALIKALEEGDLEALPTRVHARAFLVAYARACGATEEQIAERLAQPPVSGPEPSEKRPAPASVGRLSRWITGGNFSIPKVQALRAVVVLGVLLLGLGSYLLKSPGSSSVGKDGAAPVPGGTGAAAGLSATADAEAPGELSLRARRPCWVVLQIDGQRLPTVILEPNKRERWTVRNRAVMLAGNVGAVRVWWRGENLGYLGDLGERMNGLVFDPGQPWKKDPALDLALPPGVPSKAPAH